MTPVWPWHDSISVVLNSYFPSPFWEKNEFNEITLIFKMIKDAISFLVKWYMKCFIYWTVDLKSSKLWWSQLWTQFKRSRIEAWKSQDFNGTWTRDLAMPVRPSNQPSYEATDVGSWSFVNSNEPVKNGCEVIYEMFHILNCGFEIK